MERGEAKEKIDEAARAFGMPMGPIELADTVGLDVCAHVGKILKLRAGRLDKLDEMVAAGKLGKKSGEGFYVWKDGKPEKVEPEKPYDKVELERLGRELVEPLIARSPARARREDRRERRPGRRRRDLRHRLCAVPRRPAALRGQRAEVERRGAQRRATACASADYEVVRPSGDPSSLTTRKSYQFGDDYGAS